MKNRAKRRTLSTTLGGLQKSILDGPIYDGTSLYVRSQMLGQNLSALCRLGDTQDEQPDVLETLTATTQERA